MATIYDLTSDYLMVLSMATDPAIDPQAVTDTLESIEGEFEDKADGYAKIKLELEAEAEKLKAEETRLTERRKRIENNIERIKKSLFDAMKQTGKTKFKTELFSFSIQKNGGKTPVVVDVPTEDLPDAFITLIEKPDLEAIREHLEQCEGESEFAHFAERGERLSIK